MTNPANRRKKEHWNVTRHSATKPPQINHVQVITWAQQPAAPNLESEASWRAKAERKMFIKNAKEEMHELRSLYEGDEPHLLKHFRGTSSNSRQPNAGSATRYIGGKQTSTIPK